MQTVPQVFLIWRPGRILIDSNKGSPRCQAMSWSDPHDSVIMRIQVKDDSRMGHHLGAGIGHIAPIADLTRDVIL